MPSGSSKDRATTASSESTAESFSVRPVKGRRAARRSSATKPAGRFPRGWFGPGLSTRFKIFRAVVITGVLAAMLGAGIIGYAYQTTNVPKPEDVRVDQYSTIYYQSGEQMARVGTENRTIVGLDKVPVHVQYAVLAAENRSFYTDPGFSPSGIARAAWTNFTEGTSQGGSTITQQYVKNTYLTAEKSLARKFQELIIAIKLEQEYTKDEILGFYLNTIYFGRGAYGIQAAAEVYFGKPVEQLTVAEGAVLASSIRSPAGYDPQNHPEAAQARFGYVLDGMVGEGWLSQEERDAAVYPLVLPIGPAVLNQATGPEGVIVTRVKEELAGLGYSEDVINRDGLKIYTTIPKSVQDMAVAAVTEQLDGQPENLVPGLVSIDPTTGAIRAYYGNAQGTGFDFAGRGYRQPGSSFKPFVLAAGLENGYAVNTVRKGSSPMTFPDRQQPVRNSGGSGCGACTIKEAMTKSYNTTFYGLAYDIGPEKVAEVAHRAGVGETRLDNGKPTLQEDNGAVASAIGIGLYEVTVRDMASAFATFADDGQYRPPYMVEKVTDSSGNVLYEHENTSEQRFSAEVANDVTWSLRDVASWSNDPLAGGRQSAAKTGTVQLGDNDTKDAWMVGYTPQLSTAVWIGTEGSEALINSAGRSIFGAGVPGKIWQQFMNSALADAEKLSMASKQEIKGTVRNQGGSGTGTTTSRPPTNTSEAPATTEAPPTTTEQPAPPPTTTEAPAPPPEPAPTTTQPAPAPAPTTTTTPPGNGNGNGGGAEQIVSE